MHLEHLYRLRQRSIEPKESVRYTERIEENRRAGTLYALKNGKRFSRREALRLRRKKRDAHLTRLRSTCQKSREEESEYKSH